jgi:hypothetical protein
MSDLDLVTANGPLRAFTLLHDARPVMLNLGEPGVCRSICPSRIALSIGEGLTEPAQSRSLGPVDSGAALTTETVPEA